MGQTKASWLADLMDVSMELMMEIMKAEAKVYLMAHEMVHRTDYKLVAQ